MGDAYRIKDPNGVYFLTFTIVEWVDLFSREIYRDIVIDSLRYCIKEKGLIIYGYVVMSNHIHLIARAEEGNNLSDVIRDFKKFTSKRFIEAIKTENESRRAWMLTIFKNSAKANSRNKDYQVWQQENHAEELFGNEFMDQKLEYIHANPVKSGIVDNAWEYRYSSARNYNGDKGLLNVELIS